MGDAGTVIELVGNLGALGLIFWLVLRTFNHTIPRLASSFEESLCKQREDFKETLAEQRDFFAQQLERERQVEDSQSDKLVDALKDLKSEFRRG